MQGPSTLDYMGYNWTASLAVDGIVKDRTDDCRCCSSVMAESGDVQWWMLDLEKHVNVSRIVIQGRKDGSYSMYMFNMSTLMSLGSI